MPGKIFLHLLVLFGILSQEIIGTFADEELRETSDFLVRQKRVVSHVPGEDQPIKIKDAPYVVQIREHMHISCVGNILSRHVVITAVACASMDPAQYQVLSSSAYRGKGVHFHNVTEIRSRVSDPHHRAQDGVGLIVVTPPFYYSSYCQPIKLHSEPLLRTTDGKIHGWGYNFRSENRGTNIPVKLRSIQVQIISHEQCVNIYRPHLQITDKNFCTYHQERHSGHNDFGAGFVVDGYLAGVFLFSGIIGQIDPQYPDVFAVLQDSYYNQWITTNVQSINAHYDHLRH